MLIYQKQSNYLVQEKSEIHNNFVAISIRTSYYFIYGAVHNLYDVELQNKLRL